MDQITLLFDPHHDVLWLKDTEISAKILIWWKIDFPLNLLHILKESIHWLLRLGSNCSNIYAGMTELKDETIDK